jgi:hypothetical protein
MRLERGTVCLSGFTVDVGGKQRFEVATLSHGGNNA